MIEYYNRQTESYVHVCMSSYPSLIYIFITAFFHISNLVWFSAGSSLEFVFAYTLAIWHICLKYFESY